MLYKKEEDTQVRLSQSLFSDIETERYKLSSDESPDISLNKILSHHPSLTHRSYQILLVDRNKLSQFRQNIVAQQAGIMLGLPPTPSVDEQSKQPSYSFTDKKKVSGWVILSNGEQLSINIYHLPANIDTFSSFIWLPLILFLVFNSATFYYFLVHRKLWSITINYVDSMSFPKKTGTYNTYKALDFGRLGFSQEFSLLGQSLSRINHQLHQRQSRLDRLSLRLDRLITRAPLPLAIIKCNGNISFMNERFSYLFMVSLKKDDSLNISTIIDGTDKQSKIILHELSEQKIARTITVTERQTKRVYQMDIMPWFSDHGQVKGFTVMLNNISHISKELDGSLNTIEQQATRISDFERLWSVMGHELRTPLSGIIGMLELLKEYHLSPEQKETFDTLEQTSQTMLFMLNDMLDLAKMDAGKLQLSVKQTDIISMCRQVCDLMMGNARQQGIELLLFFDPSCVSQISTDEARLRQVLLNLISNAIKFTQSGYVAIRASVKTSEVSDSDIKKDIPSIQHAQQLLYFEVIDSGMGISKEGQSRLFSYFNQANNNISKQFGGTGLGLAISKNFTQMLGGEISLESSLNKGSKFTVKIPISQENRQAIYQYDLDLTKLHLVIICSQDISYDEYLKLCKHINLTVTIHVGVNNTNIDSINSQLQDIHLESKQAYTPIFLIEQEAMTNDDSKNQVSKLLNWEETPKILLGMTPERNLSMELLNEYNSFLSKPLDVNLLMSELVRFTQKNQENKNQHVSKLQHIFNQFISEPTQEIIDATELSDTEQPLTERPLILVAEDNPVNLKVISKMLTKLNYRFISVNNGQEVLDTLQENRQDISLILMDCRMPIMNGLDATRHIRNNENSIPIIALTANDTDEDRDNCLHAGMNNFLAKPIKKTTLKEILERYLVG